MKDFELWRIAIVEEAVSMPTNIDKQYEILLARCMAINLAFTKDLPQETKVELMNRNLLLAIESIAPYLATQSLERLFLLKQYIEKNG